LKSGVGQNQLVVSQLHEAFTSPRKSYGPITASAMAAIIQDTSSFAGPREFAAFLGLTPKQNSSGGKPKLGRISKMGNRYLRKLLVVVRMRCCFTASRTPTRCGCGRRS
jgi:transposase